MYCQHLEDMEPVAVVVLDGEELPISICLTQHRLAHQLGSSLLLQEDLVLDHLVLVAGPVIQLCSLLKAFSTLRSVEESLDISLESAQAFYDSGRRTIDGQYVDGVSLTYGSPRQHIWTFANAIDEAGAYRNTSRCTCTDSSRPNPPPSFVGNDYFCETGVPPGQGYRTLPSMLMIPCGMVKVVVQLAHAAHSTIHHGFVNNYLSQLMLIWKSDCAHIIWHLLKILR